MTNSIYSNINLSTYSVDIITACKDGKGGESIEFYEYEYNSAQFIKNEFAKTKSYSSEFYIRNLIANDLNADNYLDIIVTIQNLNTDAITTEIHLMDGINKKYDQVYVIEDSGFFIGDFDGDRM